MRAALNAHPASPAPPIRIEVDVTRPAPRRLALRYAITGDLAQIRLPEPAPPHRADGLWQHTCLELFLRAAAEAGYLEFNFAPSGEWAAYRFSDYRAGMAPLDAVEPQIASAGEGDGYVMTAELDLDGALGLLADLPWQIGLTAVIETVDGRKSYWAAAHPPGAPDFHHRDCFALEVPPPKLHENGSGPPSR